MCVRGGLRACACNAAHTDTLFRCVWGSFVCAGRCSCWLRNPALAWPLRVLAIPCRNTGCHGAGSFSGIVLYLRFSEHSARRFCSVCVSALPQAVGAMFVVAAFVRRVASGRSLQNVFAILAALLVCSGVPGWFARHSGLSMYWASLLGTLKLAQWRFAMYAKHWLSRRFPAKLATAVRYHDAEAMLRATAAKSKLRQQQVFMAQLAGHQANWAVCPGSGRARAQWRIWIYIRGAEDIGASMRRMSTAAQGKQNSALRCASGASGLRSAVEQEISQIMPSPVCVCVVLLDIFLGQSMIL